MGIVITHPHPTYGGSTHAPVTRSVGRLGPMSAWPWITTGSLAGWPSLPQSA